ncbi:MAG: transglutaminase-like domain-containing protein, partial [Candidatus Omnitrophota bacterium]|nr:transglutaminase-like domain-containing protein [Candidatus Omnitrophota bacterium]
MRKPFVLLVLLLVAFMAFPFCVLIGPGEAREFFYINVSYSMLVSRITEGACDDEEIALKIFNYVHENVFSLPAVLPKREKHSYDNLISSIGYCDQQSGIFVTLLRNRQIPARLVFLQDTNGSSHCVSEVLIDKKWRILDVTYGFIFRTKEGEIATFDDIQKQGINLSCDQFNLTTSKPQQEEYLALYTNRSSAEDTKNNSRKWRQEKIIGLLGGDSKENEIISELILVVSDLLGGYYKILGKPFYNLFQDLYLSRVNFIDGD